MKRLVIGFILITCMALTYVQQRVVLVGLGYQVETLRHKKEELLDQHRVLNYNVLTLRSPVILHQRLARRDVQLTPPQQVEIVPRHPVMRVSPVFQSGQGGPRGESVWLRGAGRLAARWFDNGQQAEAEPALEDR